MKGALNRTALQLHGCGRRAKSLHDVVGDESVVEVVFRLIEDQGTIAFKQRKQQDRRASLVSRKTLQWSELNSSVAPNVESDLDEILERKSLQSICQRGSRRSRRHRLGVANGLANGLCRVHVEACTRTCLAGVRSWGQLP